MKCTHSLADRGSALMAMICEPSISVCASDAFLDNCRPQGFHIVGGPIPELSSLAMKSSSGLSIIGRLISWTSSRSSKCLSLPRYLHSCIATFQDSWFEVFYIEFLEHVLKAMINPQRLRAICPYRKISALMLHAFHPCSQHGSFAQLFFRFRMRHVEHIAKLFEVVEGFFLSRRCFTWLQRPMSLSCFFAECD